MKEKYEIILVKLIIIIIIGLAIMGGISGGIRDEEARIKRKETKVTNSIQDDIKTAIFLHQMKVPPF